MLVIGGGQILYITTKTVMPGLCLFVAIPLNHSNWVLEVFRDKSCTGSTISLLLPTISFASFLAQIKLDNCLKDIFWKFYGPSLFFLSFFFFCQEMFSWVIGNLFYPCCSYLFIFYLKGYPSLCFKLRITSTQYDQLYVALFSVELTLLIWNSSDEVKGND